MLDKAEYSTFESTLNSAIVSYRISLIIFCFTRYVTLCLCLGRAMNMAACGVGGYRQILETAEYPTRWKEKTLQAGLVRSHIE